jgi:hypothetical protein
MLAATRSLLEGQDTRALEAYLDHRNIQHTVRCRATANAVQEFLARVRGSACCLDLSRTHVPGQRHPVGKRSVYEHEKPISPPYKITHDTAINYSTAGWGHAVEALMHTAQNDDVTNDREGILSDLAIGGEIVR